MLMLEPTRPLTVLRWTLVLMCEQLRRPIGASGSLSEPNPPHTAAPVRLKRRENAITPGFAQPESWLK